MVAHPVEAGVETLPPPARARRRAVGKMVGEDEKTLGHAGGESGNHHQRNCRHDLPDDILHQKYRREGDDGGEDGGGDRTIHAGDAVLGGGDRRFPGFVARHDMLADHNRVVHDDADGHNQREQRDHVDALPGEIHDGESREQRNGNAHGDPKGRAQIEEDEQHQQHQHQPADAVFQQQLDAVYEKVGFDLETLHPQTLRQGGDDFVQHLVGALRDGERIRRSRPPDRELDGRVAAARQAQPLPVEILGDRSDVAQQQFLAALGSADFQFGDVLGGAGESQRAQLTLKPALQHAGGKILVELLDAGGDVAQRHIQAIKFPLRRLHANFQIPHAANGHPIHPGGEQTVANVFGVIPQHRFREGTRDGEAHHGFKNLGASGQRALGILRQGVETGEGGFHIGQALAHVGIRVELQIHRRPPLPRRGDDFLNAVQEPQFRLQHIDDVGLHILGAGAGPRHGNPHHRNVGLRQKLPIQLHQRKETERDQHPHQQIGGVGVADEEAQQRVGRDRRHGRGALGGGGGGGGIVGGRVRGLRGHGVTTRTRMPAPTCGRRETSATSPARKPPRNNRSCPSSPTTATVRGCSRSSSPTT